MHQQPPIVTSKHAPEQLFLTSCAEKSSIISPPPVVADASPTLIKIVARAWRSFLATPQRVSVSPLNNPPIPILYLNQITPISYLIPHPHHTTLFHTLRIRLPPLISQSQGNTEKSKKA